ncbi:MAG TPA: L,D-transpeptidase [Mesorhizobium sp.]|jgi:lipoprotein-anchoring transpeptidase ErfK/SrfK|nr:L,D-transpeptidase [Mesorhizobium sp.]
MKILLLCSAAFVAVLAASPAESRDRYRERPPVMVSPDLSAPWVMQLQSPRASQPVARVRQKALRRVRPEEVAPQPDRVRTAAVKPRRQAQEEVRREINPIYLPQEVEYRTEHKPGTVVIDTKENFLYLVESDGRARRYGVGTGKPGFEWAGTHSVTRKAQWPDWRPPAEMIAREKKKGRILPAYMPGGPDNPMGARALYLGSTLYRIHGTNQPWTIGGAVSSGCIRMRNEDVTDLYERVNVGAKVVVM